MSESDFTCKLPDDCTCEDPLRPEPPNQLQSTPLPHTLRNDQYKIFGLLSSSSSERELLADNCSPAEEIVVTSDVKVGPSEAETVKRHGKMPAQQQVFPITQSVATNRQTSAVKRQGNSQQIPATLSRPVESHSEEPSTSFSCGSNEFDTKKKTLMKRLRAQQKNLLHKLRDSVPLTQDNPKASEKLILKAAREYISELEQQISSQEIEIWTAKQKNLVLQRRLDELKDRAGLRHLDALSN